MILLIFRCVLTRRRTISFPLPHLYPDIPHFKEVIIMACSCDVCGYKSNDVKAGGLWYLSIKFQLFETLCTIWCHLHNLKNVKNTHGGVLTPLWVFSGFLNCKSGSKSYKASHLYQIFLQTMFQYGTSFILKQGFSLRNFSSNFSGNCATFLTYCT